MYEFLILSLLAAAATMIGGLIPIQLKFKKEKLSYFIAIAAGVLISVSFVNIIPEALEISSYAGLGVLAGFLIMYIIEQFNMVHSCVEFSEKCKLHKITEFAFFGLLFHSFLDGVAIAAGFELSLTLGFLVALAVLIHEFPEGLAASSLLLATNYSKRKILIFLSLIAIATPVGAILTNLFLGTVNSLFLSLALGISAGTFIYIGSTDLIPHLHKKMNKKVFFSFLIGVGLILIGLVV